MQREKSCGAVVFVKNSEITYLLLRYAAGHWDFVKGNVEPNESEKGTVLRELREETGIVATQTIEGFRERIEYYYRRQGETIRKEVVFSRIIPYPISLHLAVIFLLIATRELGGAQMGLVSLTLTTLLFFTDVTFPRFTIAPTCSSRVSSKFILSIFKSSFVPTARSKTCVSNVSSVNVGGSMPVFPAMLPVNPSA